MNIFDFEEKFSVFYRKIISFSLLLVVIFTGLSMLQPNHVKNDPVILQGQNDNLDSSQINPQIDLSASSLKVSGVKVVSPSETMKSKLRGWLS